MLITVDLVIQQHLVILIKHVYDTIELLACSDRHSSTDRIFVDE